MEMSERALIERLWFPVARSEDVARDRPSTGRILDTDLVIFRTPSGPVIADDQCPHRGAALSMGRGRWGARVCVPWLAVSWRDGRCTHVPSLPGGAPPRA